MKKVIVVFWISTLCFMSCKKDDSIDENGEIPCTDELIELDTIFLSDESLDFFTYNGPEKLIFKDEDGLEATFESINPFSVNRFIQSEFQLECPEEQLTNYEFTREQLSIGFKCEQIDLQFFVNLYSWNSKNYPVFIDRFNLLFHQPPSDNLIDTLIQLNLITNYRDEEILLEEEFSDFSNFEILNEIEILNKIFLDVYHVTQPVDNVLTDLYYNKEIGLVGFKDLNQSTWVLDRIE